MSDVAIIVPVLNRPQNVKPLLDSIRASTPEPYRVLFVCDPGDIAEQDAIAAAGGWMISPGGSWAVKCNAGIRATDEELVMLGADDLTFLPGWLEAARAAMCHGAQVVGLNDMIPRPTRPTHATAFVMDRRYADLPTIDGRPGPICELYLHAGPDDELVGTAKKRGLYVYAEAARIRHDHPLVGPNAGGTKMDATYKRGMDHWPTDRRTLRRRQRLWLR